MWVGAATTPPNVTHYVTLRNRITWTVIRGGGGAEAAAAEAEAEAEAAAAATPGFEPPALTTLLHHYTTTPRHESNYRADCASVQNGGLGAGERV